MTDHRKIHEDIESLAGEYVLGLLSEADQAAFEARLPGDAGARQALRSARERLLELDVCAAPVAPSAVLWQRIEQALDRPATEDAASANVIALGERRARGDQSPVPQPTSPTPMRARARSGAGGFWRGFAAAASLAVVAAIAADPLLTPRQPRLIVVLLDAQSQPISIVEALDQTRVRIVPLQAIAVPDGKTLQVWTLPDPQTGPVSMGLLPQVQATTLAGPTLPAPRIDQLYEITLEPTGGSPTGRPTGPIVGKGFARMPRI